MTRTTLLITLAAAAALAGCSKENHTIVAGPDTGETNTVDNSNVTLPPSIAASKVYRCADNDVVYVDWLSDGKSANVRTDKDGMPTQVTAPEAGKPMTAAGGYSVAGTPTAPSVRISVPGQSVETCKA
ncbi:MAG: hypothetical protein ACJ8D5_00555 [Sphingomicrobium sp.]